MSDSVDTGDSGGTRGTRDSGGTRGTRDSGGTRGHVPPPRGSRSKSGKRKQVDSSPLSGGATSRLKYISSQGHVRGGPMISLPGSRPGQRHPVNSGSIGDDATAGPIYISSQGRRRGGAKISIQGSRRGRGHVHGRSKVSLPAPRSGSNSGTGVGDLMGDMQGFDDDPHYNDPLEDDGSRRESDDDTNDVETTPPDPSQRDSTYGDRPRGTSKRPYIDRVGEKFASYDVHHCAIEILKESFSGPWTTFRKVPLLVRKDMYARFKTRWSWDPDSEERTYEGFINILKGRYRDLMYTFRKDSTKLARDAGHKIRSKDNKFSIIRDYPPEPLHDDIWIQMCNVWDTKRWLKKSKSGANNRASTDINGKSSRHTGGCIGYDEYRVRLRNILEREPSYKELFLLTHLSKACKAKLLDQSLDLNNLEEMRFCSDRAKEAYEKYLEEMKKIYGPNFTMDDAKVWARVVKAEGKKKRIYGIGSSDLNFVVTGTPTTSYGVASSQQFPNLKEMREELREELRGELRDELRGELRDELRQDIMKDMREEMKDMMKSLLPSGTPN